MRVVAGPARVLIAIGALAASLGFWAFCAQRTILDPTATRDLATAVLDTDAVRSSLTDQLVARLMAALPADAATSAADVEAVATAVLDDPRVADAFAATIASVHEQLLAGQRQDEVAIDSRAIQRALADAAAARSPELAAALAERDPVTLRVDTGRLPDLQPIDRGVTNLLLGATLVAIAGFGLGVALHPQPWVAVGIVGRRVAAVAIAPVLLYLVVPAVLRAIASPTTETLAPWADAYGRRILPASITLMVGGIALWVGAAVGRRTVGAGPGRGGDHGRTGGDPLATAPGRRRSRAATRPGEAPTVVGPGRTDLRL